MKKSGAPAFTLRTVPDWDLRITNGWYISWWSSHRMRISTALSVVFLAASAPVYAQSCTGLACQQVACPGGGTTSISGTIYAPNSIDPLPDVMVYIPSDPAPLPAFTPGVACVLPSQPPPGSPLVGTVTAVDGTFTIANVPVGTNIPLVVQTGRWRRQAVINTAIAGACANTVADPAVTRMPRNRSEGDIPRIAVATGSADHAECVLQKMQIDTSEFTDSNGAGSVVLYPGSGSPGATAPPTPGATTAPLTESDLMGNAAILNSYDVLMLPCEGGPHPEAKQPQEYNNLVAFADGGGRVYASHYSYQWMYQNSPFSSAAVWLGSSGGAPIGIDNTPYPATVDTSFSEGNTLAQWIALPNVNAGSGDLMNIATLRQDVDGVHPPTQVWLTLNPPLGTGQVMQFVFKTPMNQPPANQCGRVLFNEYHVESQTCAASIPMSPQEKLLEYSLFELTANDNAATLTPTTQDFGTGPVNFTLSTQNFQWTNNSIFPATVTLLTGSRDFVVGPNNCRNVPSQGSCQISVTFTPTLVGVEVGTLTVGAPGTTLTAVLTGTGTSGLSTATPSMQFPSVDVGGYLVQTMQLTNVAPGAVPIPSLTTTGDYSVSSNCSNPIPINTSCTLYIRFAPTVTSLRTGSLVIGPSSYGLITELSGNGVDFSLSMDPASGAVIAGDGVTTSITTTPIAGFNGTVTLSCSTNVGGSTCTITRPYFLLAGSSTSPVVITTTSKYTVIGYGGVGGSGWLWLIAAAGTCLLWMKRRKSNLARAGVMMLLLAAAFSFTGCSGKLPDQNNPYTAPGAATYTVTATDRTISHSATYTLNVSIK